MSEGTGEPGDSEGKWDQMVKGQAEDTSQCHRLSVSQSASEQRMGMEFPLRGRLLGQGRGCSRAPSGSG